MEFIIKVSALAIAASCILIIICNIHKNTGSMIKILVITMIVALFLPYIGQIINFIKDMANTAGIDSLYIEIVMKIIGISYVATFCGSICDSLGMGDIGKNVAIAAKIMILFLAIPILTGVLNSILSILR